MDTQTSAKKTPEMKDKEVKFIICRVCGYIETADKIDQPCPACGFPKTVWMEYKPPRPMNERRRKLLELHMHPIAVHFPIAVTTMMFILSLVALWLPYSISYALFGGLTIAAVVLPVLVIIGAVSGLIGGQLRYKTLKASALRLKIILSVVYFILTLINAGIAYTYTVRPSNALIVFVVALLATAVASVLGKIGSKLFAGPFGPYRAG
ncbi:MAG: hypothetical protein SOY70_02595 [Veillonellaceae bacterium]|nr:hypothetical protein [Veillonellaceae bacterium]